MARIQLTREFYLPSPDSADYFEVRREGLDGVAYGYRNGNRYIVKAFSGRRAKPDFHYYYSTTEARDQKIEDFFKGLAEAAEYKARRKAERTGPHSFKVGDLLANSWGYSMTLVDFYEVIGTTPNGLTLVEIGSKGVPGKGDGYGQAGYITPDPSVRKGEPFKVRCGADNRPKVRAHGWASKTEVGKEHYFNTLD